MRSAQEMLVIQRAYTKKLEATAEKIADEYIESHTRELEKAIEVQEEYSMILAAQRAEAICQNNGLEQRSAGRFLVALSKAISKKLQELGYSVDTHTNENLPGGPRIILLIS